MPPPPRETTQPRGAVRGKVRGGCNGTNLRMCWNGKGSRIKHKRSVCWWWRRVMGNVVDATHFFFGFSPPGGPPPAPPPPGRDWSAPWKVSWSCAVGKSRVRVSVKRAMRKGTEGKPKTVRLRACKPSSEQSAACVWWCSQPSTHAPQCRPHSAKDVCRALCAGNERTKKKHRHSHDCCVLCAAATRVRHLLMAMLPQHV